MSFGNQVALIFSGTRGYLDEIPVEKIVQFSTELDAYMEQEHSDILKEINEEKIISDELDGKLAKAISSFVETFKVKEG